MHFPELLFFHYTRSHYYLTMILGSCDYFFVLVIFSFFLALLLVFSIKFKHLICCLFMVSKQLQGLENLLSSESIFSSSDCSKGQRGTMESDRQPLCCDQDMAQVKSWGPANLETVHPTLSDSYMKGTEKIIKLIIRKVTITVHETFLSFTQPEK